MIQKKKDNQQISKVEKTDQPVEEAAYDANDLIRNRKENELDSIKEEIDETKTVGADTLRSRQMTPKRQMDVKDAEDVKSLGMVSAQIDKAIADNAKSVASAGINPQDQVNPMMMQMM